MPVLDTILRLNAHGEEVKAVQNNLTKLGLTIPAAESTQSTLGAGTADAIKRFQASVHLPVTGMVDALTEAMLVNAAAVAGDSQLLVSGQLVMDYGLPANGVTLRLYSIGFGGAAVKLAETKTDGNGVYSLPYSLANAGANLQIRVVDAQGQETPVSGVIYNAPAQKAMYLVAPASVQPLTGEFARLAADVQRVIGGDGPQNLARAQESDNQRDLTLLNQSTGWDARLLALAATAVQQAPAIGLGADVLYALFRAGLPTDPETLALIPVATIGTALQTAAQARIVDLQPAQIRAAQSAFAAYAAKTNLGRKASGAPSTFADLLGSVITDGGQQTAFASVFFDPTVSEADLWTKAAAAGITADKIAALQLQGKLAQLTSNNSSLIQAIQQQLGPAADSAALADKDLFLESTWKDTITALAAGDPQKLEALIPATYGGATVTDQLEAYAADLARRVRVDLPTRVVARMAERGMLNIGAAQAPQVGAFLRAADSAGYQLGRTPLNVFLKNRPGSVPAPDAPTMETVKTLHRLYQITPSNESLQAALNLGFTSARDIMSYTPEGFRGRYGSSFPSLAEADLVYRKAQQVAAVTLNLFAAAKQLDVQPAIYALSTSAEARQAARAAFTRQFPSMAGLFGSLDFCECQDCRSVLSPAAYLVDVLHFLDPDPTDWQSTLASWQQAHDGHAYPFGTPFQALSARRPDLPNLNLSCENTNTALPYIDVVNEILECFVANQGSLQNMVYDTGTASSADLVAEPQNTLPAAYAVLANRIPASPAVYPLGLPFDLWTETVRGFLSYFKIPLSHLLEVFRPGEPLELLTDANNYPSYQSAIFVESLGLSAVEYALYTNPNLLSNWFSLYGYGDQPTAVGELTSAKALADQLEITYKDLASLVETGFLNPSLAPLTIPLRRFGLSLRDVFAYTGQPGYNTPALTPAEKAAYETRLQSLVQQHYPKNDPRALQNWLNSVLSAGYSNSVLVLRPPAENSGDFEHTTFQYAGGNAADALDFLKLNLFVRLWKKLKWSIDEIDRALQLFLSPFLPAPTDPNLGSTLAKAMPGALIYLSHLQSLAATLQPGPYGRRGILPIWSDLPTTGENSLYAQLFLTDAVLNNDSIFDSPTGQYLCYFDSAQGKYVPYRWRATQTTEDVPSGYVLLANHSTAIQGALGLTAQDVESILADNQLDIASAPLTLANVSLLYRYALLSQGLQLSVDDLIALTAMSTDQFNSLPLNPLNPFDALATTPLAVLRDDHPWGETLQLCQQAAAVQGSGFSVQDLQYLLRHRIVDPAGPYNEDPAGVAQQVRALAAAIHAIQSQTAVPADPMTLTDTLIRQKISQVFPANIAQTFMGMWTGTIQYTATPVHAAAAIPENVLAAHPSVQLVYDPVQQTQTLILQGVPTSATMNSLSAALATLVTQGAISGAQQSLIQGLLDDIRAKALTFFQTWLQQSTVGGQQTGFLQPADFETIFSAPSGGATARATLAAKFLPFLQNQLIHQAIIQFLVAQLGSDTSLTKTLLTNTAVLSDPIQATVPPTPLLAAFQACGDTGLSVTYFSGNVEESATVLAAAMVPTANTDQATNPAKPNPVNSARFEGYLEVPADGPYSFTALLPDNTASATLRFDFMTAPLTLGAGTPNGSPLIYPYSGYTQLKAGLLYHFTLELKGLAGGDASLLVQGETLPQGPLSQLTLYPEASVQRFGRARVLLAKTWQLLRGFKLDEKEVLYLTSNSADFGNISFNALPTQAADDSIANAQELFGQFLRLANYSALKEGPAGGTDGLITVFQNARQTIPVTPLPPGVTTPLQLASQNLYQAIANLTRRDVATVQSAIAQLWGPAAIQTATTGLGAGAQFQFTATPLVNDLGFRRLWEALEMLQTLGVQPQVLKQVSGIASASRALVSLDPDPGIGIASALRNALKAQYTPEQWRPVAQPVFDSLRQSKRDALCDYVLTLPAIQQFGATGTKGLFEFFLVDPGMEPVVQTSRIRLALSSVQTFIQRCLLNLEPQVKPSVLDSDRWEWMKRYRVWEANRKIFLWPENWLIPEFRENATDLFQTLQGTLLQADITPDLAEQAFTNYLQDLEVRARLDIVSLFNEPPAPGEPSTANTLHVIGRHHGKPTKYFYRTFSNGIWNGWIPVTPDLEGDHIVAVIWRGRLTVFWLTFVVQSQPPAAGTGGQTNPDQTTGSTTVTDLTFDDFSSLVETGKPPQTVQVQLHWSEFYQGKWTPRKASDITRFTPVAVYDGFKPASDVFVHASIDRDEAGEETAVRIHMDGLGLSFRLTGKNSEPGCSAAYWQARNYVPFTTSGWDATKNIGYVTDPPANAAGAPFFQASFVRELTLINGQPQMLKNSVEPVLQTVGSFNLLLCDNLPQPGDALTAANAANSTDYVYALFMGQTGALSSPFFYEDTSDPNANQELTFLVQPSVTESSFRRWRGWAIGPFYPNLAMTDPRFWKTISLTPQVPVRNPPGPPDPEAVFQYRPNVDWLASEGTLVSYGTSVVGRAGGIKVPERFASAVVAVEPPGLTLPNVRLFPTRAETRVISSSGLDYASALSYALKAQTRINLLAHNSH